jgi:glycosyltransferase involved in cell wall biosynthesis
VLAATLHVHEPGTKLTVLLLDTDGQGVGEIEHARTVALAEIVGEQGGLLAAANPPGALPMATLPHLIGMLLNAGAESVVYLGAGQRVLGPLPELAEALGEHEIVLVSRVTLPDSAGVAATPVADEIRGAYSRSLLAVRSGQSTSTLLSAWPSYFAGGEDDGAGAVRTWLDGIPAIAEGVGVLREPGYGLDPWTLALRSLGEDEHSLQVNGRPARTIDLSEVDPSDPSACFGGADGITLSSSAGLAGVVRGHCEELLAAGYERDVSQRPGFAALADGLTLTPMIRTFVTDAIHAGELTSSPFAEPGRTELYDAWNRPAGKGAAFGLTRLHAAIWAAKDELRSAYPHLDGPDGPGYAGWLCAHGVDDEGLVEALLPPTPEPAFRDADPHAHEDDARFGVNVVGFFTAELGVGEAARLLLSGLDAAAVPALPIQGHLAPPSRQGVEFSYARVDEAAYPINILCINGDGIPVFAREAGRSFFDGRYTIALWWWEVGDPPAGWSRAYDFVDEIWVASQHIYDALAPTSPVPVVRVTLPVLAPKADRLTRSELGLPQDGFLFMYVHDYHSVEARKNALGLIEAFRNAFPPGSGAKLVLKSINAETRPREHERVLLAVGRHEDITLIDGYLSATEKNAMIAACDCYVSLHRSEGFGLTVAEAMLLGKPVIATRYGGTGEFMNDENSYLVRWDSGAVGEDAYPYAPGDTWAEPDLDHAAALMREVLSNPQLARARGDVARRQLLEGHSAAVAGETMRRRLSLIHERLLADGKRTLNLTHLPSLIDRAAAPGAGDPPPVEWGTGLLARIKRRALRPLDAWIQAYLKHEIAVDLEVDRAVGRIDERLRDVALTLQEQQKVQHSETLAMLRGLRDADEIRGPTQQPVKPADGPPELHRAHRERDLEPPLDDLASLAEEPS